MNSESRRKIEMGRRALEFCVAHPDTEPGTATVVTRLEQLVARAEDTATAQRNGLLQVGAAAERKEELRRSMRAGPIAHLSQVGRAAAREEHELGNAFRSSKPGSNTFMSFRTAARSMAAAAESGKEVLLRHGLSQPVLERFAGDGQLLGSWISASTVLGVPRPGSEPEEGTPAGGEVRPAA